MFTFRLNAPGTPRSFLLRLLLISKRRRVQRLNTYHSRKFLVGNIDWPDFRVFLQGDKRLKKKLRVMNGLEQCTIAKYAI